MENWSHEDLVECFFNFLQVVVIETPGSDRFQLSD